MEPKRWTEDEILAFDAENAYFERKSGEFLSTSGFDEKLAKQLSAFANTEGGLIVIGLNDDGMPDGVDRMFNDRLERRQWLSQKVGSLLAPRLQAVHVDHVIPSDPSSIPRDKVLLTIEVQKSILAPHQTVKECLYYYRVGSESLPAPHHYVESLFSRSRFPGPAVATAWIATVVNPLLGQLEAEKDANNRGNWGFEFTRPTRLRNLRILLSSDISVNFEQFLIYNHEILDLIEFHDAAVENLIKCLAASHNRLTEWWAENLSEFMSLERLSELNHNEKNPEAARFRSCQLREDYFAKLFHDPTPSEMTKWLALSMTNPLNGNYNFMPFMRVHGDHFKKIRAEVFPSDVYEIAQTQSECAKAIDELARALRSVRIGLSEKYGLPFEA